MSWNFNANNTRLIGQGSRQIPPVLVSRCDIGANNSVSFNVVLSIGTLDVHLNVQDNSMSCEVA